MRAHLRILLKPESRIHGFLASLASDHAVNRAIARSKAIGNFRRGIRQFHLTTVTKSHTSLVIDQGCEPAGVSLAGPGCRHPRHRRRPRPGRPDLPVSPQPGVPCADRASPASRGSSPLASSHAAASGMSVVFFGPQGPTSRPDAPHRHRHRHRRCVRSWRGPRSRSGSGRRAPCR